MNVVSLFVTHPEAAVVEQPIEGHLNYITKSAQAAAVTKVTLGDQRNNSSTAQRLADLLLGVISTVSQKEGRAIPTFAGRLFNRWNGIHQGNSHLRVVHVGPGVSDGQGRSRRVGDQMAFRAVLAPIGGVWAGLCPPKSARVEQESRAAADHSIMLDLPISSSNNCQVLSQTPAICQSRNRRQQVIPHPQPISCGSSSHWMPVRKTKRMPVRAARSGIRGRPPLGLAGSGGKSGLIRPHSSSVSSGLAMTVSSLTPAKYRPNDPPLLRFC